MRALLAILFAAGTAHAEEWKSSDKYLMTSFVAMQVVDVKQTDKALKRGGEELNPIYGNNPTMMRLVGYKTVGIGLVYLLADRDESNRAGVLIAANVVQFLVIGHNYAYVQIGF